LSVVRCISCIAQKVCSVHFSPVLHAPCSMPF